MSKEQVDVAYASDLPYVPVNWEHRDIVVGRILTILEAAIPQGPQFNATKRLVQDSMSEVWTSLFNYQFESIKGLVPIRDDIKPYQDAIYEKYIELHQPGVENPYK